MHCFHTGIADSFFSSHVLFPFFASHYHACSQNFPKNQIRNAKIAITPIASGSRSSQNARITASLSFRLISIGSCFFFSSRAFFLASFLTVRRPFSNSIFFFCPSGCVSDFFAFSSSSNSRSGLGPCPKFKFSLHFLYCQKILYIVTSYKVFISYISVLRCFLCTFLCRIWTACTEFTSGRRIRRRRKISA